jgi:ubiquinone/menaquinone biosynthesis C-methylase UbiE
MTKIKDSRYSTEEVKYFEEFERNRAVVLKANQKLLTDLYNSVFEGDERVLEVGCGAAFLKRSMPEHKGEWVQLDSKAVIQKAKELYPEGTYKVGSVYKLPFPDESFDVVCGFNSYDMFYDLEKAVNETHRVLKKGGVFFHGLDLYPCIAPIQDDLKRAGIHYLPVAWKIVDGEWRTQAIWYIPPKNEAKAHKEEKEKVFENPDIDSEEERMEKFLEIHPQIMRKYGKRLDAHKYFRKKLILTLSPCFNGVKSKKLTACHEGERLDIHDKESFIFFNDAGLQCRYPLPEDSIYTPVNLNKLKKIYPELDDFLGYDHANLILEVSSINYVRARKKPVCKAL